MATVSKLTSQIAQRYDLKLKENQFRVLSNMFFIWGLLFSLFWFGVFTDNHFIIEVSVVLIVGAGVFNNNFQALTECSTGRFTEAFRRSIMLATMNSFFIVAGFIIIIYF